MFHVTSEWIMPANIAIAAVFILLFAAGAKRGLLRQIVALAGTFASFFLAWHASSVLTRYIRLWPKEWAILQDTPYAEIARLYMNQICWLIVVFLVLRLLFLLLDKIAKGLGEIPIIDSINEIGGGLFGLVEAAVLAAVFTISLGTPLFQNGTILQEETVLKQINGVTGSLFRQFVSPVLSGRALQQLYQKGEELTEEQRQNLETWLQENGFEELEQDVSWRPAMEYEVIDEL